MKIEQDSLLREAGEQGLREYISVTNILNLHDFFKKEQCFVNIIVKLLQIGDMTVSVSNKETSCTHEEKAISLMKFKPCNKL